MSVINQVLNDLEKRGVTALPGDTAIRAVAAQSKQRKVAVWVVCSLVALLLAAGYWWNNHQRQSAAPEIMTPISPAQAPAPPTAAPQAEPLPNATAAPEGTAKEITQDVGVPALHLSFELNSIPLPSNLRAQLPAIAAPVINSVSPDPVMATGVAQPFMINGGNFPERPRVNLHSSEGQTYANRPVISQTPAQIVINPNFGTKPGVWMVEVINRSGASSGSFAFSVQSPHDSTAATDRLKRAAPSVSAKKIKVPAAVSTATGVPLGGANQQLKQFSAQQLLDNEFRRATALVQQGRSNEAYRVYEAVLKQDAGYDAARQAMVAILLDSKRNTEAEHLLQDGLQRNVKHSGFAMLLARLQVERGAVSQALETLNKTLPYADRQADYQAFVAALMQRQSKHPEAIEHYQIAVQLLPTSGVWLMGLGISLHAVQRNEEARAAFTRAIETGKLSTELRAFVEQQLKELG